MQHEVPVIGYWNFVAKVPVLSMTHENPHRLLPIQQIEAALEETGRSAG